MTINPSLLFSRRMMINLSLVILFGIILEIWAVNRLASFGTQYFKINNSKNELILENQLLKNQIARQSSLSVTADFATSLGFEKISKVSYLQQPDLALNH